MKTLGVMGLEDDLRRAKSREQFRQEIIKSNADWWLSWECDIIPDSKAMFMSLPFLHATDILTFSYPDREKSHRISGGIGFCFFRTSFLEGTDFLAGGGVGNCDPLEPNCSYGNDSWIVTQILRKGARMIEITNSIAFEHINV